jgi:hypothetical protein
MIEIVEDLALTLAKHGAQPSLRLSDSFTAAAKGGGAVGDRCTNKTKAAKDIYRCNIKDLVLTKKYTSFSQSGKRTNLHRYFTPH